MITLYLLIFVFLCYFLIKSEEVLIAFLVKFSRYFKFTERILTSFLMIFAIALPELIVAIASSFGKLSVISLGNVLGSNLISLTFILGIIAVTLGEVKVVSKIVRRDAWIAFVIAFLPVFLALRGNISRVGGLILIAVFCWYVYYIFKTKKEFKHRVNYISNPLVESENILRLIAHFLLAIVVVILSSWGLVEITKLIAVNLYVPISLIAVTLIAVGTALPELVFGTRSKIVKHEGLSFENIISSIIVNSTFIVGIAAIINPIKIENPKIILITGGFMLLAIFVANIFLKNDKKISKKEGWVLIGFYILFLIAEFIFR